MIYVQEKHLLLTIVKLTMVCFLTSLWACSVNVPSPSQDIAYGGAFSCLLLVFFCLNYILFYFILILEQDISKIKERSL